MKKRMIFLALLLAAFCGNQVVAQESIPPDEVEPSRQEETIESVNLDLTDYSGGWYLGAQWGMLFGVSSFSSFAPQGGGGFQGGLLVGYRLSPLFAVEALLSTGRMKLGSEACCSDYWLGADGNRYLAPVVGMDSYSYSTLYSSVALQQYGVGLNIDLLQLWAPSRENRWSLQLMPALYGSSTQATLKMDELKLKRGESTFQLGLATGLGAGYRVTPTLGIRLYSGVVWMAGKGMDGVAPTNHASNLVWNPTVSLIWEVRTKNEKKKMKKIEAIIGLLILLVVGCSRDESHITITTDPNYPQGAMILTLNSEQVTHASFNDIHIYGFNRSQELVLHRYYATPNELANEMLKLKPGGYTLVAVLNVGESFEPSEGSRVTDELSAVTLSQFLSYLNEQKVNYPLLVSGWANHTIEYNQIHRFEIVLGDQTDALATSLVSLEVALPDWELGHYEAPLLRGVEPYHLRAVVEFYQTGKRMPVNHLVSVLTPTATAGKYLVTAQMPYDEYEAAIWIDYCESGQTGDLWYDTSSLQAVKLIAENKTYYSACDSRAAYYGQVTVTAQTNQVAVAVATARPHAKYRIITDDLDRYRQLQVANPGKYPPLEELSVAVSYETFHPNGFDTRLGRPNSADVGYKCSALPLPALTDAQKEVKIARDYLFMNEGESSVAVTVTVTDRQGKLVSNVKGVVIAYQCDKITSIRGSFLTAGVVNPGIHIDTDWEGVYDIEF